MQYRDDTANLALFAGAQPPGKLIAFVLSARASTRTQPRRPASRDAPSRPPLVAVRRADCAGRVRRPDNGPVFSGRNLAVDVAGNVFVADMANDAIRKVTPAGVVTTLTGPRTGFVDGAGGAVRFGGDLSLFVGQLGAVAVDGDGTMFVADPLNHAVRKISRTGIVTTLAGNGSRGFANGIGGAASFDGPTGVAIDGAGNVYVADTGNHRIRRITAGGVVSSFAGSGVAGSSDGPVASATFDSPGYLAVGPHGDVYVSDRTVRRIAPDGMVSTITGIANATLARVTPNVAEDIVASAGGRVVFKGTWCCVKVGFGGPGANLFEIDAAGSAVQVTEDYTTDSEAGGVALDSQGNIYYGPPGAGLLKLTPDKVRTQVAGAARRRPLGGLYDNSMAIDRNGNFVIADALNGAIRILLP